MKAKITKRLPIYLALMALSSCGAPSYQKAGPGGLLGPGIGYSERKTSTNEFMVTYVGSMEDDHLTVKSYLDRRIKEVGQEQCGGHYGISSRTSGQRSLTRGGGVYGSHWEETAMVTCKS